MMALKRYAEGVKHHSPGLCFSTLGMKSSKSRTLKRFNKGKGKYSYKHQVESRWGSFQSGALLYPGCLKSKHPKKNRRAKLQFCEDIFLLKTPPRKTEVLHSGRVVGNRFLLARATAL